MKRIFGSEYENTQCVMRRYISYVLKDYSPDFTITFLDNSPFLRIPARSNSTRPLKPSSIKIHPLNPLDMQSFQNDV